jgi:CheY-like chemotaxis protein
MTKQGTSRLHPHNLGGFAMSTMLSRNRSPHQVGDTDDYNRLQLQRLVRRLFRPTGDLSCRPLRVLIVDDHRAAADTLSMLVRLWGHDVRQAYDGVSGLAEAVEYLPDVLLLDLMMPDMNGQTLATKVGQHAQLKDCVIIAVTGSTDELRYEFCSFVGISAVLIKPVLPADMEMLLARESDHLLRSLRQAAICRRRAMKTTTIGSVRLYERRKSPHAGLPVASVAGKGCEAC